ncbi:SDR family oxidoreductase [Plantactinospora sp. B24E8]|uniref:SDR family oxidoreductase n=1 Tax=Plantactinospora sp. B24E8 TaxID=3153567 RepID=UPI00325E03A8
MGTLTGKTALVTGASRGIGRAIALRLAAEGALVAVHYGSNEAAAKETIDLIAGAGGRAFPVRAELGVPGDVATVWSGFDAGLHALDVEPGLDILVNNAAIARSEALDGVTPAEFDALFAVNVKAPLFLVQQGLDRIRDNGRIINIGSGVTRIAYPETIAYSMSKGALDTFSLTLAKALGPRNITVNSVSPGIVDTDVNAGWLRDNPDAWTHAAAYSTFNRVGQPADIADVVAFVASSDARWISGQNIDATGGSHL